MYDISNKKYVIKAKINESFYWSTSFCYVKIASEWS